MDAVADEVVGTTSTVVDSKGEGLIGVIRVPSATMLIIIDPYKYPFKGQAQSYFSQQKGAPTGGDFPPASPTAYVQQYASPYTLLGLVIIILWTLWLHISLHILITLQILRPWLAIPPSGRPFLLP